MLHGYLSFFFRERNPRIVGGIRNMVLRRNSGRAMAARGDAIRPALSDFHTRANRMCVGRLGPGPATRENEPTSTQN